MINDFVGIGDLSQGLAFVTLLPTRFLARPFAQTRHPRRLRQPIARRRLAAVRAVPPEPTLKFGDLRLKSRDLACLAATNAISSSRDGSAAESAFIESLNRRLIPVSAKSTRSAPQNLSGSLGSYERMNNPPKWRLRRIVRRVGKQSFSSGVTIRRHLHQSDNSGER